MTDFYSYFDMWIVSTELKFFAPLRGSCIRSKGSLALNILATGSGFFLYLVNRV